MIRVGSGHFKYSFVNPKSWRPFRRVHGVPAPPPSGIFKDISLRVFCLFHTLLSIFKIKI